MRFFKKIKDDFRGFTMAEVVIAFAVVSIVSIATLSLILTSVTATKNANYKLDAQNFTEDVIECYRVCNNEADFLSAVSFAIGVDVDDSSSIILPKSGYKMNISLADGTLNISVQTENGKEITSATFSKGGGF